MFSAKSRRLACLSTLLLSCIAASARLTAQSDAPAAAPAKSPVNGVASTDKPEIAAIQKVEDNWSLAVNNRDQYGIELVLSPLFVGVGANGSVTMRNQEVANLINGEDNFISAMAENGAVQLRIEVNQGQQESRADSLVSLVSGETNVDLPDTIVRLSQAQTAYQAALQSAASIMRISLLDYIK